MLSFPFQPKAQEARGGLKVPIVAVDRRRRWVLLLELLARLLDDRLQALIRDFAVLAPDDVKDDIWLDEL